MWPAALVPKHLTFPGEKSVLQTFPLLPAAPACTTSQHPLPLRISLVFIPSANFTSSSLSCRSQIRGCCSVVIGSFSSYLLFAFFFLPLSLSLHFTTHASAPFASTSWVFCFLKVTRLAHVTGHKSRGLCSRAGEMKEDNTHNMPCTSLSCIDQKCTAWPNAATVLYWKKENMKIFLKAEVHKATVGGSAKIPYSQQKEIFPWSSSCFYNLFPGVPECQYTGSKGNIVLQVWL